MCKKGIVTLSLVTALMAGGAAAQEEKVLHVYNWSDYIAEDTIANFEKESGIKVVYDVFDSNEVLEAKLLAGNTGFDVVIPSSDFLARQIQAGVFMSLDKSKLPNLGNMDADVMTLLKDKDPDNAHSIPYLGGTCCAQAGEPLQVEQVWRLLPECADRDFRDCAALHRQGLKLHQHRGLQRSG